MKNDPIRKQLVVGTEVPEEGVVRFVASTDDVDRDGDIIRVSGWDLEAWERNPVFLWAHNRGAPPLGRGVGYEIGEKLVIDVLFAERGRDYDDWPAVIPSPETVRRLYEGGFLNAVSVGFLPKRYKLAWDMEDEERSALGLGEFGVLYEEQELFELSAVPVPANPNALRLALERGFVDEDQAKVWKDFLDRGHSVDELVSRLKAAVQEAVQHAMTRLAAKDLDRAGLGNAEDVESGSDADLILDFRRLWDDV